jgi:hypothetical protein
MEYVEIFVIPPKLDYASDVSLSVRGRGS